MHRPFDARLWTRDNRHRARFDGGGNEIFGVKTRTAKRAKHCAWSDLAVINCKASDGHARALISHRKTNPFAQRRQLHFLSLSRYSNALTSTSRV